MALGGNDIHEAIADLQLASVSSDAIARQVALAQRQFLATITQNLQFMGNMALFEAYRPQQEAGLLDHGNTSNMGTRNTSVEHAPVAEGLQRLSHEFPTAIIRSP